MRKQVVKKLTSYSTPLGKRHFLKRPSTPLGKTEDSMPPICHPPPSSLHLNFKPLTSPHLSPLTSHIDLTTISLRHSIIITAGKTPGFHLIFDALDFYRHNKTLLGLNTLGISLKSAISELAALKFGFEAGVFLPPALIEEVDILDEKAVIAAYEKVKAGTKAKQVLVSPGKQ